MGSTFVASGASAQSISQLISQGQVAAAQEKLEQSDPTNTDRLFFQGQVLKATRKFPQAITTFREVLRQNPQHLNARRELAHTLLMTKNYNVAKFHFETLLDIDRNTTMQAGYSNFLNVIAQNKPSGISGYFSLLPSSNINRGTNNTVFDTTLGQFVIDPNAQPESGIGVQVGVSGYYRHLLNPKTRLVFNWDVSGKRYESKRFNSANGNLSVSYEKVTPNGRWSITPYLRYSWREDDAGSRTRGLRFALDHKLTNQTRFGLSFSHEYRDFTDQDYRDGNFSLAQFSLRHQINPSLSLNGGIGLERSDPNAEHLQYDSYKFFASISKAWEGGLHTSFGIEGGSRNFAGIYPLTASPRDDAFYGLKFSVYNSQINYAGFTPQLSCSYTNNRSNVTFYDYAATECQMTISKNF